MGQRYSDAIAKMAKSENMFLVKQDIGHVPEQVEGFINLLDLHHGGPKPAAESEAKPAK